MPKTDTQADKKLSPRPPVIVIMGHIDHGKSSLLDYIRKTNIVAKEAGGITQHLGAYEVEWNKKQITFIDTPGHAAFTGMRERGAQVADIAILIVSAVEGVQAQTKEALKTIQNAKIPFIVAINKIDRPEASPDKAKQELAENEVFVEGYGGTVPCVLISAKNGTGIDDLLDTILLVSEMEEFSAHTQANAEGAVIESLLDPKRGATAIMIVRKGTLMAGSFIAVDGAVSPVRILENFLGKPIKQAPPSSSVRLSGLAKVPKAGAEFCTFPTKKEAEAFVNETHEASQKKALDGGDGTKLMVPLVIKTDVLGTLEAVEREISKLESDSVGFKTILAGAGSLTEGDIKIALGGNETPVIIAFHVKVEKAAQDLAEANNISIHSFDIIYKLTEMLAEELKRRAPKVEVEETVGRAKILKTFSKERDLQVVGGGVISGVISQGKQVKIIRQEHEIARGRIVELQQAKQKAKEVEAGKQFGTRIECKMTIAEGDIIEVFELVQK